ncbi:MAG TPA: membrane protein insertion efficiency factor YidD [Bacteroidota bacterium]|nr:membrane protein insertion efficiency factor YidD [Bacteroidota bacterium]
MTFVAKLFIQLYQRVLAYVFPPDSCRFYPTCSSYALEAFEKRGFFRALYLSVRRLLRCHPFHPGGYDPVP